MCISAERQKHRCAKKERGKHIMSLMLEVFQKDSLTGDYGVQAENSRHFIFRLAKSQKSDQYQSVLNTNPGCQSIKTCGMI